MPMIQPGDSTATGRVILAGGAAVARLAPDGRISLTGCATPAMPDLGYRPARPDARVIDALAALLAQDLAQTHGACTVVAG